MARTRRVQVLMEPDEHRQLQRIARREGVPVAQLIRDAVRDRYFLTPRDKTKRIEEILRMNLPIDEWKEIEHGLP